MLTVFGEDAGEEHDFYVCRVKKYLFEKSVQLVDSGINVIIDIGLWSKEERKTAREFYGARNISIELHYIDISNEEWQRRIVKRNRENDGLSYHIDSGLIEKAMRLFEEPDESEVDVLIR